MNRVDKLNAIFKIYEDEIGKYNFYCNEGCSTCCTGNVILTSLECENLLKIDIDIDSLKKNLGSERFHPKLTTNMIADHMKNGLDLPEENIDSSWGKCVFLEKDLCSVYEKRPFGCRCMVSSVNCKDSDYAETDPYILTLNNVILQYIEHLDHEGFTGNILDMVIFKSDLTERFIKNRKMSILMVPFEHREKIGPVLSSLSKLFKGNL
ncbi:MAG: YkgJ family cysteine cluster protein [Deltaproteobacteria bacterium]|nr:YkgJ family cysteine cluster protein [Deltaproteobacteria bacterium]